MRIISDYHDYYDTIGKTDGDRQTIYQRKQQPGKKLENRGFYFTDASPRVLGFCGKIYPMVRLSGQRESKTFFNPDIAINWVAENMTASNYRALKRRRWGLLVDIRRFFEKQRPDFYPDFPIWFASRTQGIINPCLRIVVPEFVSIMPPVAAYQELVMWFGKRAAPEPTIPITSDEIKAASHGFDKFSFRKDKS